MPFRNKSNSESIRWLEKLLFNLLTQNTVCWIRKWLWTNIVTLSSLSLKKVSFLSSLFFHWEKWQGNKKSLFSIDEGRSYFTGETIEWARGKRMGSIQSWEGRKLILTFLSFTKTLFFVKIVLHNTAFKSKSLVDKWLKFLLKNQIFNCKTWFKNRKITQNYTFTARPKNTVNLPLRIT